MLDTIRYWLALLFLVFWPAGFSVWFVVHPFAHFWRRVGPWGAYTCAGLIATAIGFAIVLARDQLLAVEYGAHALTLIGGGAALVAAQLLDLWVRRYLRFPILMGLPELSEDRSGDELLTQGPFALVRHPRYSVLLGLFGVALFSNYLAIYLMAAVMTLLINLLASLEERELMHRFGAAYSDYAARTPRFIPSLSKRG